MFDPVDCLLELPAALCREEGCGGALDDSVADTGDLFIREVRNESDAACRIKIEMAGEAPGEIEPVEICAGLPQVFQDDLQACDIGSLGLCQQADVGFAQVDGACLRELEKICIVCEAANPATSATTAMPAKPRPAARLSGIDLITNPNNTNAAM